MLNETLREMLVSQASFLTRDSKKIPRLNHRKSFILQISILILHLTGDWVEIYKMPCSYRIWTSLNLSPEKVSFFPIIQAHHGWASIFFSSTISPIPSRNAGFVFLCFILALFACFLVITINYVAWLGLTCLGLVSLGFGVFWIQKWLLYPAKMCLYGHLSRWWLTTLVHR